MHQTVGNIALKTQGYWAFIDGLRAVAVLSVVLYHAGLPWLPGGYIGVDIFFVISGYLIIGQIVAQRSRGTFSFSEFWSRRALRILPPYLLVILVCSMVAPFVLVMPGEFEAFANEVAYSALMIVNHLFLEQQGYFDTGADTKVLLHLWSLAVEEQFYIVAPLLIAALWWLRRSFFRLVVLGLFAASLWACVHWTGARGDKNFAFFLMPLRAWEFIAGGAVAVAVPVVARLPRIFREALAFAGALSLCYAITTFTHYTPFPSYWAAIPVFGSSAIILAGMSGPGVVRWILQTPPMVAIGLISYSWYLWHWPALVLARIYHFGEHIPGVDASMVVLSAALASATYFLVERPIRRIREARGMPLGWTSALAGLAVCAVVSFAGYTIFMNRADFVAEQNSALFPDRPGNAGNCDLRTASNITTCIDTHAGKPLGVLIGDSHAAAATRALVDVAEKGNAGLMALASGACISLVTTTNRIPDSAMAANCQKYRENGRKRLVEGRPTYAILYSYWTIYGDLKTEYYFTSSSGDKVSDQHGTFVSGFRETADYLRGLGVRRILVLGPTPTFPRSAPECVARSLRYQIDPDERCAQRRDAEDQRRQTILKWIDEAKDGFSDIRVVDPIEVFCDAEYCRPFGNGMVYFNDTNHISDAGILAIRDRFITDFEWALTGR